MHQRCANQVESQSTSDELTQFGCIGHGCEKMHIKNVLFYFVSQLTTQKQIQVVFQDFDSKPTRIKSDEKQIQFLSHFCCQKATTLSQC